MKKERYYRAIELNNRFYWRKMNELPAPAAFIDELGTSVEKTCGRSIKEVIDHMKIKLHLQNRYFEITKRQCRKLKIHIQPDTTDNPFHHLLFDKKTKRELTNSQAAYLADNAWAVYDDREDIVLPVRYTV